MSAFLILAVSIYFSSNKIVIEFAAKSFNSMISSASYHAVDALIEKKYKYSDLVDIKRIAAVHRHKTAVGGGNRNLDIVKGRLRSIDQ